MGLGGNVPLRAESKSVNLVQELKEAFKPFSENIFSIICCQVFPLETSIAVPKYYILLLFQVNKNTTARYEGVKSAEVFSNKAMPWGADVLWSLQRITYHG